MTRFCLIFSFSFVIFGEFCVWFSTKKIANLSLFMPWKVEQRKWWNCIEVVWNTRTCRTLNTYITNNAYEMCTRHSNIFVHVYKKNLGAVWQSHIQILRHIWRIYNHMSDGKSHFKEHQTRKVTFSYDFKMTYLFIVFYQLFWYCKGMIVVKTFYCIIAYLEFLP